MYASILILYFTFIPWSESSFAKSLREYPQNREILLNGETHARNFFSAADQWDEFLDDWKCFDPRIEKQTKMPNICEMLNRNFVTPRKSAKQIPAVVFNEFNKVMLAKTCYGLKCETQSEDEVDAPRRLPFTVIIGHKYADNDGKTSRRNLRWFYVARTITKPGYGLVNELMDRILYEEKQDNSTLPTANQKLESRNSSPLEIKEKSFPNDIDQTQPDSDVLRSKETKPNQELERNSPEISQHQSDNSASTNNENFGVNKFGYRITRPTYYASNLTQSEESNLKKPTKEKNISESGHLSSASGSLGFESNMRLLLKNLDVPEYYNSSFSLEGSELSVQSTAAKRSSRVASYNDSDEKILKNEFDRIKLRDNRKSETASEYDNKIYLDSTNETSSSQEFNLLAAPTQSKNFKLPTERERYREKPKNRKTPSKNDYEQSKNKKNIEMKKSNENNASKNGQKAIPETQGSGSLRKEKKDEFYNSKGKDRANAKSRPKKEGITHSKSSRKVDETHESIREQNRKLLRFHSSRASKNENNESFREEKRDSRGKSFREKSVKDLASELFNIRREKVQTERAEDTHSETPSSTLSLTSKKGSIESSSGERKDKDTRRSIRNEKSVKEKKKGKQKSNEQTSPKSKIRENERLQEQNQKKYEKHSLTNDNTASSRNNKEGKKIKISTNEEKLERQLSKNGKTLSSKTKEEKASKISQIKEILEKQSSKKTDNIVYSRPNETEIINEIPSNKFTSVGNDGALEKKLSKIIDNTLSPRTNEIFPNKNFTSSGEKNLPKQYAFKERAKDDAFQKPKVQKGMLKRSSSNPLLKRYGREQLLTNETSPCQRKNNSEKYFKQDWPEQDLKSFRISQSHSLKERERAPTNMEHPGHTEIRSTSRIFPPLTVEEIQHGPSSNTEVDTSNEKRKKKSIAKKIISKLVNRKSSKY